MPNYLTLPIEIEQVETGYYLATSPILPGFILEVPTIEDVYKEAPEAARILLEAYRDHGKPIPPELQSPSDHLAIQILVPA